MPPRPMPLAISVPLVLAGFASNSLLCRAALGGGEADAVSFSALRLAAGILFLVAFLRVQRGAWAIPRPDPGRATALAIYMLGFSLAYRSLSAGTGALLLFGAVQMTMLGAAKLRGEPFPALKRIGALLAFAGLLVLALPKAGRPPALPALSMASAGAAWGIYSLRGRGSTQPVVDTLGNFTGAWVLAMAAFLIPMAHHLSLKGLALAAISGALASGAAYALWYAVLPRLGAIRAGIAQLAVPLLTAAAASLLLSEAPGTAWFIAAALTLSGIALASRP